MYYAPQFYWKGSWSWLQLGRPKWLVFIRPKFNMFYNFWFTTTWRTFMINKVWWRYGLLRYHIFQQQLVRQLLRQLRTQHVSLKLSFSFFFPWLIFIPWNLFSWKWRRLVEIPAYLCGIYVTDKVGRRPTLCAGMIISGLACLITGLVPEGRPIPSLLGLYKTFLFK
jgi:hypothetical protein